MSRLLIVHHTVSPVTHELFGQVLKGATTDEIEDVEVVTEPALGATAADLLAADGLIMGTTANIGYMSGALKHFLDTVYYPCLAETRRLPYGLYVHGDNDTTGAVRAVESIAASLGWERAVKPVTVTGRPGKADLEACWDLGATVAAGL
ncbi:flavodoxin [Nonomuraea typhae]|uniref:flavodoxin n=1 Tax=Nonomuraea typhae TaxID=2603600 RepID=UPI0012FBCC54|nr:flavodoxin [Nonomuraea typhae]